MFVCFKVREKPRIFLKIRLFNIVLTTIKKLRLNYSYDLDCDKDEKRNTESEGVGKKMVIGVRGREKMQKEIEDGKS